MDPLSGFIETLEAMGVLKRGGSWYSTIDGSIKFQSKDLAKYVDQLLEIAEAQTDTFIKVVNDDMEEDPEQGSTKSDDKMKRYANAGAADDAGDVE
jgi:hypothetical protein